MTTSSDLPELHQRAVEEFGRYLTHIGDHQWDEPTPCDAWSVRDLVNHVIGENAWTAPLFAGQTIEEVGDRFEGDLLGVDHGAAWSTYAAQAIAAVHQPGALDRTVHLSFGDVPGRDYAMQLTADMVIHSWDLARAIGADERLEPDLVEALAAWFPGVAQGYRDAGAVAPPPAVPAGADVQTRLLAEFGRSA